MHSCRSWVIWFAALLLLPAAGMGAQGASPEPKPEVAALLQRGIGLAQGPQGPEALRLFGEALALAERLGDRPGQARALSELGILRRRIGDREAGARELERSAAVYREVPDARGEGRAVFFLGEHAMQAGRMPEAHDRFEGSLRLFRGAGDRTAIAASLNRLGALHRRTGELQRSLDYLSQALAIYRETKNRGGEGATLGALANVYDDAGETAVSLEFQLQALALAREVKNRFNEAAIASGVGIAYIALKNYPEATRYLEDSLKLAREIGSRSSEATALGNLAMIYADQRQLERAAQSCQEAIPLFQQLRDPYGEAVAWMNLGSIRTRQGRDPDALDPYRRALALHRQSQETLETARTLGALGGALLRQGDLDGAETRFAESVSLFEGLRSSLGGLSSTKTSFLTTALEYYHDYLELLLRRGKRAEAFALAQKTKARSLLDVLAAGKIDLTTRMTEEERRQEQELRRRADAINVRMVKEGVENEVGAKKRFAALKVELAAVERELRVFLDGLSARHPDAARRQPARTIGLDEVGRFLPSDTALLEYVTIEPRLTPTTTRADLDQTVLLVVTAARGRIAVRAHRIRVPRAVLARRVERFREACADPRKSYRVLARDLHRLLIAPAAPELAGKRRLLICPDGPLWDVPFSALIGPRSAWGVQAFRSSGPAIARKGIRERFLVERFEIAYASSATGAAAALAARRDGRRPVGTLLAVANPAFGDGKRFGDNPEIAGQRPIDTPSRPIDTPSRPLDTPSRPIDVPSRPIVAPSRPIDVPSRPIVAPSRPLIAPSRPIDRPSRPLVAPSRPLDRPSRPIVAPSRPIVAPSRPIVAPSRPLPAPSRPIDLPSRALVAASRAIDTPSRLVAAAPATLPFLRAGRIAALPGTQREAEALRRWFPGARLLLRQQAQEAAARAEAGRYRYLHLASHAFVNDAAPLLSSVVLAQPPPGSPDDGFLTAREILDLDLSADLVVLSACNTARGEKKSGEGIIGLTWALFAAGAPTQVLSQWAVDDAATARLMAGFYRRLARGTAKGAALRRSALRLQADGRHRHPYYWAPFVLLGDWR